MKGLVDFNMIVQINQLLKEKGYDYSVHAVGGCSCCGLELRGQHDKQLIDDVIEVINKYLETKWMKIERNDHNPMMLYIASKFSFERGESNG